jgi:protein-L-isoaspartate(D-aspartate) O-methyltransferase
MGRTRTEVRVCRPFDFDYGRAMTDFVRLRRAMVDGQVRVNDVTDPRIIDAMLDIPRERFVPPSRAGLAYIDEDLPLGSGRYLIEPMVLAKLVHALALSQSDRVLDVGCATGYGAVLLSRLAGRVVAVEEEPELAVAAQRLLAELAPDVSLVVGPLTAGAEGEGPFDAILMEGSIETVPEALVRQLKEGGRLAAVIGSGGMGRATLHVRAGRVLSRRPVFDAAVPPLPGFALPRQFVF